MDKQRPKKLFCTLDLDGQTYPIYFALTQEYRYTMPKQKYCETLTVRNTPSIWSSALEHRQTTTKENYFKPLTVRNTHLFGPKPESMDNNAQTKLFCTLDSQKYPIYFGLTQQYGQTTTKENYYEPLTVRNTHLFVPQPESMYKQRPNKIILNP